MKLQTKLLAIFVPMALLTGGIVTLLTRRAVRTVVLEETEKRGLSAAADLVDELAGGFAAKSEALLLPSLQAFQVKAGALYAAALDPSGLVMAHTNVVETGKVYADPETREALLSGEPVTRQAFKGERAVLDIHLPVWQREEDESFLLAGRRDRTRVGTLRFAIPLKDALATERRISRQIFWIVALIGGVVLAVGLALLRRVLLPIRFLSKGTEKIGRGEYGARIPVLSRDELGDLTRRFNQMSEALGETIAELREARDKVIRSEKLAAIGQLASGVGHELRNPLGTIRNVIYYVGESLKDSDLARKDPALKELLGQADKEIRSASDIINDLLDFSRVVRLTVQPTDVCALLDGLPKAVEVPPQVSLEVASEPGLPPARLDPQRMNQVFVNLALNAIQAMPKGGALRVRARAENGDGRAWLVVEFEDTGAGIPPDRIKKIFEPLFSTKAKGTGLGLAICQGIVEAHGGEIRVSSEVEKGSTFTVRTPLEGPPHVGKSG